MRLLTDHPRLFEDFLHVPVEWEPVERKSDSDASSCVWKLLGRDSAGWTAPYTPDSPNRFWEHVVLMSEADRSQFDLLRDALRAQRPVSGPVAALALKGHGFHGQRDRRWQSPFGNLYLTVYFPTDLPAAEFQSTLTMFPAVAAVDSIRERQPDAAAGIKWINDIVVEGRKVGGVLTQTVLDQGSITDCVLGIGLNVGKTPAIEPTPFVPAATCLAEVSQDGTHALHDVFWSVLRHLARRYNEAVQDKGKALFHAYRDASYLLTKLFPGPTRSKTDPFVMAAIESSVRARFPSARVTDIQPIESNSASQAKHDIH